MSAIQQLLTDHIDIWTAAEIEKRSGRGRASSSAASVYGIKKLRELILDLAMRGKLVAQDATEEPASELLKRIKTAKAKLLSEGKIKKDRQLVPLADADKYFDLPTGWEWSRFGEYGTVGSSSRVHQKDWTTSGIPFYRAREIVLLSRHGSIDNELFISEDLFRDLTAKGIVPEADDLMITGVGTIGVPYVVAKNDRFYFKDASVLIFKNDYSIFTGYLFLFLISPTWNKKIHAESMGTTVHTLTIARANEVAIPIPPLAEQHRIVAKVDELMVLCDQLEAQHSDAADAHEQLVSHMLGTLTQSQSAAALNINWQRMAAHFDTLFTTEASIDALKQTLLQLAVMGKLVAQDANDEPASELLKRIQAEKEKLVSEGKIKKGKPFPKIADDKKIYTQRRGWKIINFGEIMELISGQHLNPSEYFETAENDSIPYITGPADFSDNGPIPTRHTRERRAIACCGDILVTVKGSGVGKTNSVHQDELAISRQLMAIRPILVNISFVDNLLLTLAQVFQDSTVGIAIPGISREDVLHAQIALPPLAEQIRIVAKIDELMAMCGQLRTRITTTNQQQKKLADVLVEHAVVG